MQFDSNFVMKPTRELIRERNLQERGPVQRFIDQEIIRLMDPYTPMLSGELVKSATLGTRIGTGEIHHIAPYARYQYYGMLMVSSITGSSYAIYGEDKVLTDTDLQYNTSKHLLAGPFWFERMKADKKEQILRGARKVASGR